MSEKLGDVRNVCGRRIGEIFGARQIFAGYLCDIAVTTFYFDDVTA